MRTWLNRHLQFLDRTEAWFNDARSRFRRQLQCGKGCTLCCYGLFDISFADALILAEGFGGLNAQRREPARERAVVIQAVIRRAAPDFRSPFLLHGLPETLVDTIVEAAGEPRCPLLSEDEECLVYQYRPLACRLEGLPMVDVRDGLFGDWCELNFKNGVPPEELSFLALDYYALQSQEDTATEVMADLLLGIRERDLTVFIPSIIMEYDSFWRGLLDRLSGADS